MEFLLYQDPKWKFETKDGDEIIRLEELADYEVTSGEFQISEKNCPDSKPEDFRPVSIRFQNGVGKLKFSAGVEWYCGKSRSFRESISSIFGEPFRRYGSIASLWPCAGHFRFTPNFGPVAAPHWLTQSAFTEGGGLHAIMLATASSEGWHR